GARAGAAGTALFPPPPLPVTTTSRCESKGRRAGTAPHSGAVGGESISGRPVRLLADSRRLRRSRGRWAERSPRAPQVVCPAGPAGGAIAANRDPCPAETPPSETRTDRRLLSGTRRGRRHDRAA